MNLLDQPIEFAPLPCALPAWQADVDAQALVDFCVTARAAGGRLVTLWGTDERDRGAGFALHVALGIHPGLALLHLPLAADAPAAPDLSGIFPSAGRLQRGQRDLLGIAIAGEDADPRPWLRHASWPQPLFPLRRDADAKQQVEGAAHDYPFVPVEGEGVHEIPVGPIHAGIIEPGHFRFSIVGEKVLRLEQHLGFKHKGIDRRFLGLSATEGYRLAGRVSGDSTVAYAWAYSMAFEALAGINPPARAQSLRAIMLERERVANHLGDLGALGNDAAFSFGLAQFLRLKEDWLRLNARLFGHRMLMDCIVPGGVAHDVPEEARDLLPAQCNAIEDDVLRLKAIYDDHAGLQDRFLTTGRLAPELAAQLGIVGIAGRASAQALDLRCQYPIPPYDQLDVRMATHRNGDVAARVTVRFEEVLESLRLIRRTIDHLPYGEVAAALPATLPAGLGAGWIEGWRGEVLVALEADGAGGIRRCHCHDPSWHIWPALEHAIMGNIVPDFPLINKSFNLSYSGQDL